ncbi:MAG: acyl carrier protein [Firmicutes bacterium]|nr:acyl carrier protein [Bacillota bacterium]
MNRQEVAQKIINIMYKEGLIKSYEINLDVSLVNDLGVNSISIIQLITAIEEVFNFEFDSSELDIEIYKSINTIIDTVMKHLENAS